MTNATVSYIDCSSFGGY